MTRAKAPERPERVILLVAGESGSGKSFFVANLANALIFDTDVGGGLSYADARIRRNGSERVEVGSYPEVIDYLTKHRADLGSYTTVAIDHLSTLQQEAVLRWNPGFQENTFGREHDRANKEWRKVRDLIRWADFHLVCTSHLKAKYVKKEVVGQQCDASKNIEADFTTYLHLASKGPNSHPATAHVIKWRRDPEDERGKLPTTFPFLVSEFVRLHGSPLEGTRQAVALASPEQVAEMERFLAVVKLPEGTTETWLSKAKADSWNEFSEANLQKCIDHLKGLVANGKKEAP